MKNLQINQTSIGQQEYNLVEKVGTDLNIFKGQLGIPVSEAKAADILMYQVSTDTKFIVKGDDDFSKYPSPDYVPIGVVVIPASHNVYGDGSCGVMSLKEMNCDTPDSGSTSYNSMYWGGYGDDISLHNFDTVCHVGNQDNLSETVQGTTSYAYLPSDKSSFDALDNPYDTETGYYYNDSDYHIPSPYKNDGSFNTEYSRTSSPSDSNNAMSDFEGVENSQVLWDLSTSQSNWKTASGITNNSGSGYYPAACCCWRYHTNGTKQGNWYLPACGELGYMIVRFQKIAYAITKMRNAYGSSVGVELNTNNYYWSSSEYSSNYARGVDTFYGNVNGGGKSYRRCVRAFTRFKE